MSEDIRILLADDHTVLRQGMAQVLDAQPDMSVISQAGTGKEAVLLAVKDQPDVILMDINMPEMDGVEASRQITKTHPEAGIIILTMYRQDEYVFEAIKAGARGYLLKEVELDELLAAIRAVAAGRAIIDPALLGRVLATLRDPGQAPNVQAPILNERDLEILRLVAKGQTNQEIADGLFLAEKTIRNRLSRIFKKLNLDNRTQAAIYAMRTGLIEPPQDSRH